MSILAQNGPLCIREMEPAPADFSQYARWMADPALRPYWSTAADGDTPEKAAAKYRSRLSGGVVPCFFCLEGRPVGYCQFYPVTRENYDLTPAQYARLFPAGGSAFAMDLFLGERRDQGLGTAFLGLLCAFLFARFRPDLLLIDPKTDNLRAIACYQKCGFRPLFTAPGRELQDGVPRDNLILGLRRESLPGGSSAI